MKVNFLASLPLSEKDKQKKAQDLAIQKIGNSFYSLGLEERGQLRKECYDELFSSPKTTNTAVSISLPIEAKTSDSSQFAELADKIINEDSASTETKREIVIVPEKKESFALDITLNERQTLACDYAFAGKCFALTGAAGTGKTTALRELAKRLFFSGKLGYHDFKIKGAGEKVTAPSIAFVAFTNRAASNMARNILKDPDLQDLSPCITTIHNLLEYEPVFYEIEDPENPGMMKKTMRFEPQRHAGNPLKITHLIIEESSQVGALDLYPKLFDALRHNVQVIFVGDINQLQPIFSPSILNYALVNLPVVNLEEVYRQALDSPIIANAHRVLRGESLEQSLPFFKYISGKNIKKIPSETNCANLVVNSLKKWSEELQEDGTFAYDPEQDMLLSPFNKHGCGTIEVNYKIAEFLGKKRQTIVYEIIAGIRKLYLAEGDKVMYYKQDGYIKSIAVNGLYVGKMPKSASKDLNRFGQKLVSLEGKEETPDEDFELHGYENLSIDTGPNDEDEKRKQQASHSITIALEDGREVTVTNAGDLSEANFSLGYCLTVHKAQGCEWRKVFILLHRNHATLLNRELIYTAITRAREFCIVIDLCNVVDKAIKNQRIKGNSVEEKIQWFNSEVSLKEPVALIP